MLKFEDISIDKLNRWPTYWEKISETSTANKGLIAKIYMLLLQINKKKEPQ